MNVWDTVLGNRTLESINSMAHDVGKIRDNQPTLRDWFAMQVLNGLATNQQWASYEKAAEQAYAMADVMLEARKKSNGIGRK